MLTPSPEEYDFYRADAQRAGLVRPRWRGGYKPTRRGRFYLWDAEQRHDDLRAEVSVTMEQWTARTMTKADRDESFAVLVVLAWKLDREGEAKALAELRSSSGFDLLAPEVRAEMRERFGIDPADNRVWRQDAKQS